MKKKGTFHYCHLSLMTWKWHNNSVTLPMLTYTEATHQTHQADWHSALTNLNSQHQNGLQLDRGEGRGERGEGRGERGEGYRVTAKSPLRWDTNRSRIVLASNGTSKHYSHAIWIALHALFCWTCNTHCYICYLQHLLGIFNKFVYSI